MCPSPHTVRYQAALLTALALSACASATSNGGDATTTITVAECQSPADCAESAACRYDAALPALVPVGSCYPAGSVAVVDASRCQSGQGLGTSAAPFCEAQEAISQGFNLLVLHPRSDGGAYAPVALSSGAVTILGPGRDALTPVVLSGAAVQQRPATLALWDLIISGDERPFAVTCSAGELGLYRVSVQNSPGGVDASAGCGLTIARSRLIYNGGAALRTDADVSFSVINSLIAGNGASFSSSDRQAGIDLVVDLESALRATTFAFNTVVQNQGGVACRLGQVLTSSILTSQSASRAVPNPTCTLTTSFTGVDGAAQLDSQFRLTAASTGCIDQAAPDPSVTSDFFGTPRPQRQGYDIGFCELR